MGRMGGKEASNADEADVAAALAAIPSRLMPLMGQHLISIAI
jgi:hypothetical protein